jgi:hypothetical protein
VNISKKIPGGPTRNTSRELAGNTNRSIKRNTPVKMAGIIPARIVVQVIPVLAILLSFPSCIKEEFDVDALDPTLQINPGVAAPVGWVRYQLDEVLFDSLNPDDMIVDENGFISLVYRQDLYSLEASEIISLGDIPPQNFGFDNPFGVTTDLSFLPGDSSFYDTVKFTIPLPAATGAEIDSILLRSGRITITVSTGYPGMTWRARIQLLDVPEGSITLDDDSITATDDLDGTTLPLDNTPPGTNQLCIAVILTLFPSDVTIAPGPIVDVNIAFSDLEYSAIYGYLGEFEIDLDAQTFQVNFYSRLTEGNFYFSNPRYTIDFLNSFGLPIGIAMTDFEVTGSGGTIPVTVDDVDTANPYIIAYPGPGQEGVSVEDEMILDTSNTSLFDPDVLGPTTDHISVGVVGGTNPEGITHDNFVLDSSSLTASTELLLPLDGWAYFIVMVDTLEFNFSEFYDNPPEEIKRVIFRLNYVTQFPVDVETQITFCDQAGTELDSLFHLPGEQDDRRIIKGTDQFDGNGVAIPRYDAVEIELTREQIDHISDSYYMIGKGKVYTSGFNPALPPSSPSARFYSFYYVRTHIGVIAELELNSDDY